MSIAPQVHPLFKSPLPGNWQIVTADAIKSPEKGACVAGPFGSDISSKYFCESGVPVIRGNNLRRDLTRFVADGFAFVSEERATKYKAQHVKAGDLVFTCWGTVGQVGMIPANGPFPEYIISNKQLKLRVDPSVTDPLYAFYYFAGPAMVDHILGKAIGAAVPGINLGILKALPFVLPPLPVQRRIAGILSAYDELIENSQRRIRLLEDMARALYREWFVHFRFPGHDSVPRLPSALGDIPQGWEAGKLEDVLVLQRGFDLPKAQRVEGSLPIYAATGINGYHNEAKVKAPGIVTGRSGSLGEVVYVQEDFWPLNTALWVKAFPKSEPLYAYFLLSEIDLKGFNSGAAVPTLNRNDIHGLDALIPPRELQRRFQGIAGAMLRQSRTLTLQIQNLRRTRDLLLPRLLSGQVEVTRATEIAS